MIKITCYVFEECDNAAADILLKPEEKLADWLWDHNLEVYDIVAEKVGGVDDAHVRDEDKGYANIELNNNGLNN
jgi:hypothetical protein